MLVDEDHCFTAEDISSPIAAHIFDFCDDGSGGDDFFSAVNTASNVFASSSEDASSSTTATHPLCSDNSSSISTPAAATAFSASLPSMDSTLSALLEEDQPPGADGELFLPNIDYTFAAAVAVDAPQMGQQFGQMVLPVPVPATAEQHHPALQTQMSSTATELMQLGYNDECFPAAWAGVLMGLDETLCQQQQQQQSGVMLPPPVGDATATQGCYAAPGGFFGNGCSGITMSMLGMEEMGDYQRLMEGGAGSLLGDADPAAQMAFACTAAAAGEMQMGGSGSPGRLPAGESSSLEDSNFKTARLSVEERKEKIHRYIKKRNERNFSKKIKYACRKTLADSRPRVRGRFAKNDDYLESSRATGSEHHEEYDRQMGGVKGEDMIDPDTLSHISGMSSYMYSHPVESWM